MMNWLIETGQEGKKPQIISEYFLDDTGVYVKREARMPKGDALTAVSGFRVGYIKVKNADYRMAPMD